MHRTVLQGITWNHSRGITPLLAAAQRYQELHPEVEIQWKKRSLQEFADMPIEALTHHYDLLIIDHPWVGCAAATKCVLPLNEYLPAPYLAEQAANSTGESHPSYMYDGGQWALAIDAATPAASYRKDLLAAPPTTWEEVLALAAKGKVAVPAIPIDLLMNFYTFCIANGQTPFLQQDTVVGRETGIRALETMKQLYSLVDKRMFTCNPIAVAELMTRTDDYWYCPFAYGYSNYSRFGYADHLLQYTSVVSYEGTPLRTTVGGTGLAVSAFSEHQQVALDFAAWVVSEKIQRTLYVQNGGQPGHRAAWLDEAANTLTNNYFKAVLPLMDNGYIRPRYNGYLHFQDHAGLPVQQCLQGTLSILHTLEEMDRIYRASFVTHQTTTTV
ncbi:extracellular solute-binding protein [Chitinophaga horti]|uniref:Extracellular solute-binding protein n=1 Tax=Chitinophaga horti TaxID=2920382 RepID=A0ABY6J7E0_9BACT|nr:extracellular solute-binding protein [Chitinophaga horti]UYQ95563.1 extracellular solute-binding protein [Chitinophaga horti]